MHSPAGDPFPYVLVFIGFLLTIGSSAVGGIFDGRHVEAPVEAPVEVLDVSFDRCLDVCAGDLWSWSPTSCACGCR